MENRTTYVIARVTVKEKKDLIARITKEGYKNMTELLRSILGL